MTHFGKIIAQQHALAQQMALMTRLYVGNVSFDLNEEDVKSLFISFGPIKSVQLIKVRKRPLKMLLMMLKDPNTGRSKGYGFIEFFVPDSATAAENAMNNFPLMGRYGRLSCVCRVRSLEQWSPRSLTNMSCVCLRFLLFVFVTIVPCRFSPFFSV